MTTARPAAVLWDLDGTLVDTEPYWMASETELVRRHGGSWDRDDALGLVGAPLLSSARVLQRHGVRMSGPEIVEWLTDRVLERMTERMPWRPGAVELLEALHAAGTPTALVTMSIRRMAERVQLALPFPAFDVVVAGDDVVNGKPHPEAYLRAAALLGVDASACIAIEDSLPGMTSAAAAGAVVIGIPAHVPVPAGVDDVRWPSLAGRTVDDLRRAYARGAAA
ncbi:MAG: HAD family phosphatase [Microbacteriaceae bacterium]